MGDLQDAALRLADDFSEQDVKFLKSLTPAERAAQAAAREALARYMTCVWEAPKHLPDCPGLWAVWERGAECICVTQMSIAEADRREMTGPAHRPQYDSVAGVKDLMEALMGNIGAVQAEMGDDDADGDE